MILTYSQYQQKGGKLDQSAFNILNRRAENKIKSQANGMTGQRISELTVLPSFLTDLIFDLISVYENTNPLAQSESQSMGNVSESITYKNDVDNEIDYIIRDCFSANGMISLLYKGLEND